MNVYEKLHIVQTKLKCNKSQYNSFGKYNYRNCEDILEGVKPLLDEVKALIVISDEIVNIDSRYYVKSEARFIDYEAKESPIQVSNTAYAREEEAKKGMDSSQVTGATSSYARKYALNGLFCIDDTKDADSMDNTKNDNKQDKVKRVCSMCGREIKGFTSNGITYTDEKALEFALTRGNGTPLCGYCAKAK